MLGIVLEDFVEQRIGHWRKGHRRARVTAVGRLDGVHRQGANRVNGQLFDADGGDGHSCAQLPDWSINRTNLKPTECTRCRDGSSTYLPKL
jgi:hypothetical protein